MQFNNWITSIETHTMGEPTRVVTSGLGPIPGQDMSEKKTWFADHKDYIRRSLLWEPRGHRDMFGAIITSPTVPEADIGILFMDSEGYLDMCGHGSMGVVTAVLETGIISLESVTNTFEKSLVLDTPAGLIEIRAQIHNGKCYEVCIRNQLAFWHSTVQMVIQGKELSVDVVYGGNYFGMINASDLGLEIDPSNLPDLIPLALNLLVQLNKKLQLRHPLTKAPSRVALIEFYTEHEPHKNVVILGAGQVDRSPCGTGTCAKMALLHKKGKLFPNEFYIQQSILGTEFTGTIVEEIQIGENQAIIPEISGKAFITGFNQFVIDPNDPFPQGFQL